MPIKINLLKNRHTLSETEYQKEQAYFRYAMFSAVAIAFVTLGIAAWQFISLRQLNAIETRISVATGKLAGLADANAKQVYLKSRLKLITSFLDARSTSRQAIQRVFSIAIPGVSVTGASFESDNVIRMQAIADNILSFSDLLDYFGQDSDFFVQIVSDGIVRLQDGKYQMEVLLTIPQG